MNKSKKSIVVQLFFLTIVPILILWSTAKAEFPWPWPWWIKYMEGEWSLETEQEKLNLKIQSAKCSNISTNNENQFHRCLNVYCGGIRRFLDQHQQKFSEDSDSFIEGFKISCANSEKDRDITQVFVKPYFFNEESFNKISLEKKEGENFFLLNDVHFTGWVYFEFYVQNPISDLKVNEKMKATYKGKSSIILGD